MINKNTALACICLGMSLLCSCQKTKQTPPLSPLENYLTEVGKTPVRFDPDNISTSGIEYNSSWSQVHNEFYFSMAAPDFSFRNMMMSKLEKGVFQKPQKVEIGNTIFDASDLQITNDGSYLYFKMRGNIPGDPIRRDGNVWRSKRIDNQWAEAELLPETVNSALSEYYPIMTNSGNLYFSRENESTSYDIYVSKSVNGSFQQATALPDYINTELLESDAYIAPDESYMIFVRMYADDGLGVSDLYISFSENGIWSKPRNMTSLNSNGVDGSPFVTNDGKYLFFTSTRDSPAPEEFDGHLDIYVVRFDVEDWK